ncbi:MAG: TatD family deoxyribonuclease [Ruminococcaceae bacterium]|nr:TatD family deoxyribonuclease [Oscillospiraceae bacterium]
MLFDTHAHYDDAKLDGIRDELLAQMQENGIDFIVNAGVNIETGVNSRSLAETYPFVYYAAGIHPSDAPVIADRQGTVDSLKELLAHKKAVALGEIGLDYHYEPETSSVQKEWFDFQLSLAEELKLPVIVHDREAHGDCMDIVRAHPNVRGVFHSYSGSVEMAKELLRRGWLLSFTGVVTFKNAHRVAEVVTYVPLDRLMLETDCPYLTPHPHRGELNSSLYLHYIAEKIAEIKCIDYHEVCQTTTQNARTFFGI